MQLSAVALTTERRAEIAAFLKQRFGFGDPDKPVLREQLSGFWDESEARMSDLCDAGSKRTLDTDEREELGELVDLLAFAEEESGSKYPMVQKGRAALRTQTKKAVATAADTPTHTRRDVEALLKEGLSKSKAKRIASRWDAGS